VAALASPAPGNGPPISNQAPAKAMPGMAQQKEEVANQPWAACPQHAQQALNSAGYQVTNMIDGQGFEGNFYGVGNGKSAVIGCAQVGMEVIYTITTSSMNGEMDADAEATRLHNMIFAARPAQ
jgi:ABC-type transport system substrate-binding protein